MTPDDVRLWHFRKANAARKLQKMYLLQASSPTYTKSVAHLKRRANMHKREADFHHACYEALTPTPV